MAATPRAISDAEQLLKQANTLASTLDHGSTEQAAALTARDAISGLCTILWTLREPA